jgi:elongation factor 1-alpha
VVTAGYTPVFHAHTAQVACTLERLHMKWTGPAATAAPDPDLVESGEFVEATVEPERPLALEPVDRVPQLATVAVRDMGQPVAVGVATEVEPR